MLKLLIILFMSFLIVSCNTVDKLACFFKAETEVSALILYRARSPTKKIRYKISNFTSYCINLYLLSKGCYLSEGSQIVPDGVEPPPCAPNKNRRDFNFT